MTRLRTFSIVLWALAAVVVGVGLASVLHSPRYSIRAIAPLGPDSSVLILRPDSADDTGLVAVAVRMDGTRKWTVEIPDFEVPLPPEDLEFTDGSSELFVLGKVGGVPTLLALFEKDGRELWRLSLPNAGEEGQQRDTLTFIGSSSLLVTRHSRVAGTDHSQTSFSAIDLDTRQIAWRLTDINHAVGTKVQPLIVARDRFILAGVIDSPSDLEATLPEDSPVLDARTGAQVGTLPFILKGWRTRLGLVGLSPDALYLITQNADDIEVPSAILPLRPYHTPFLYSAFVGTFGELIVFGICAAERGDVTRAVCSLRGYDTATRKVRWEHAFPEGYQFWPVPDEAGILTRLSPIVGWQPRDAFGNHDNVLSVIDLQTGELVTQEVRTEDSPTLVTLAFGVVYDLKTQTFSQSKGLGYPPKTPQLLDRDQLSRQHRLDSASARLWVYKTDLAGMGGLPWTVFDIPSGFVMRK